MTADPTMNGECFRDGKPLEEYLHDEGITIYTPELNSGAAEWIDSTVTVTHHPRHNNPGKVETITADEIVIAFDTGGVNLNDDFLRGMFVAQCQRDFEAILLDMLAAAQREVNGGRSNDG